MARDHLILGHPGLAGRASRLLQLSVLLVGLRPACIAAQPGRGTTGTGGQVPVADLNVLTMGLVHLLQGVEDHAGRLGGQRDQVSAGLEESRQTLDGLRKQGLQAGRTHRQVRKDLQMLSAKGDMVERVVQDLKLGLGDLVREQAALEGRMSHVLHRVPEPVSGGGGPEVNMSLLKVMVDKQARRLAYLAAEITARDRRINRHQQQVEHLEKQMSRTGGRRSRSGPDAGIVV